MPKITDVAHKAGVSVTTVSRVLNNRGYISEATRDKVYKAMKDINYQPNELARSLYRRKSNTIGLIVPNVSHPFFSELTYYLEHFAHKKHYKLLLCNSNRDVNKEKEYIELLKQNQVEGVIMGSQVLEVENYLNLNLPIVSFDRALSKNIPVVTSDNYLGGKLASDLLIKKKCEDIAYIYGGIGGPHHTALLANDRYQGFLEGIKTRKDQISLITKELNTSEIESMVEEVSEFLKINPTIDGIFASSDIIASTIIQACYRLKKAIPDDLKIIGYDGVELSTVITPPLTTISQPLEKLSELTIDLLIRQIKGEKVPFNNLLPVSLVERGTT
ncbi:LacI family DNA-binding transcriptional regulator [Aquibacillus koreensis]|uniref:LacI family DNA-binding transcriptional regulator n=1 Tax=Aquibacillus koreensis TaxID=279446 RepID=A0A9X3WQJ6_9BACI|nr:LacI family DNA-binding transcriptional regulator [Aquibacillus koreensis]MCT2536710.1 LacI family DNA-binding transcriptional regulator [Aquibacillus koreensis]MDC3421534.1 LacI family DNA-binding transcriptional regulator [Aquibacillus koreensis]